MKKYTSFIFVLILALTSALFARDPKQRIVFEKYLFAEGVDAKARYLDQLMVKFFDEDMVRLRDGQLVSTNGRNSLLYTKDFLARHPEVRLEKIITDMSEEDYAAMIQRGEAISGKKTGDLFSFYRFRLPVADANPKALLADILNAPEVEIAYYQSIPMQACSDLGSVTGDYFPEQTYHDPAPLGVDLDFARATYTVETTDGVTSTNTGVIETGNNGANAGFQLGHEDFTTVINATPESTPLNSTYHGTAVGGIVGACDENNVGCVGFTADHVIRFYDIGALASIAAVYNRANSQLSAGEYTTNSWGFGSNPMPAGQSCPCNPGQNGMVPPEYDPATKTAIDNGTTLGIFYFLSAGNGCTDLDDAVFGNTFRWATDTWSSYIGAVDPNVTHNASCFTNFGERVTLNAWGDGITTLGYGDRHTGTATYNEYYASSFGGTSGAGPIAAGCAGVVNNIYRSLNGGSNVAPNTMRSWLASYGTSPGTTPGYIGVQPNLRGITAPELNPDLRTGWDYDVVPRNAGDATSSAAALPTTLVSDPDTTFWNSSIENTSNIGTATPAYWRLYRDDVWFLGATLGSLGPLGRTYHTNSHSTGMNVRGGRHTIRITCDPLDEVAEASETNNDYVVQFVWNPKSLTSESPLTVTAPPLRLVTGQPGSNYNCDGYTLNSGFSGNWDLFGVIAATTAADYDARIYSEAITSTNGFDTYEAWSSYVGLVDIVGKNQHNVAGTALASAINWDGENDSYNVEGESSTYMGIPGDGRNSAGAFTIGTNEVMEAEEFYVNELTTYTIEAAMTSGNANIVISVFGPDDSYFALSGRNASANDNPAGQSEQLCFLPTQVGYHLAVIHKYNSNDYGESASFSLYIGKSQFDLTHNLNSGWSDKIVVRQVSGGTPAVLPATLTGNNSTNYLNAAYINQGCVSSLAGINTRFYRDGLSVITTGSWASHAAGATTQWTNQGPIFMFGGRHSIGDSIDVFGEGAEWLENNNRYDVQYVWTPYQMTNQVTYLTGNPAPNFRNTQSSVFFSAWNQDGWRFTGSNRWSGAAYCPVDTADYYVGGLYTPTTGSTDGFDTYLVPSFGSGQGGVGFFVENGNTNGVSSFDMGITNNYSWPGTPSVGAYRTYQCNSLQDLAMDALNGPFTLGANQLIHVFDLQMTAGVGVPIILDNLGAENLGLAIFDPTDSYGSRSSNGTVINAAGDGADETTTFVPTATGRHGVVVFKTNNADLPACAYRLIVGNRAPAAPQHLVLQVLDVSTDPLQMRAHWDSVTVDVNGAPMNVDHYQLYYTLSPTVATFPAGWTPYLTTTLATQDFLVGSSINYFRMVVVAVDADGFILWHSDLPEGTSLSGHELAPNASATDANRIIEPVGGLTPLMVK
jgi:hypothetical protein